MKERPILFSAPMVRALLEGRKTMTRRVVKLPKSLAGGDLSRAWPDKMFGVTPGLHIPMPDGTVQRLRNPWGWPEPSRLWVKERIMRGYGGNMNMSRYVADDFPTVADAWPWKRDHLSSIHCPRGLSRILLEITDVRVERLNQITELDAIAEGIERVGGVTSCSPWRNYRIGKRGEMHQHCSAPTRSYLTLWESINGAGSWGANPWCWCISFKKVEP